VHTAAALKERRPAARVTLLASQADCAPAVARAELGDVLVLCTTVADGTTRRLLAEPLATRGLEVGADVFVAHSVADTIGAVTTNCLERAARGLPPGLRPVTSPEASELVALHRAAIEAVQAAAADELAETARAFGVDPLEVAAAAGAPRPGQRPYTRALVGLLRHRMPVLERALQQLQARPARIAERLERLLAARGIPLLEAKVLVVATAGDLADLVPNELAARGAIADHHDPRSGRPAPEATDYEAVVVCGWQRRADRRWLDGARLVLDCTYSGPPGHARYMA
jgi:hypothetical protein